MFNVVERHKCHKIFQGLKRGSMILDVLTLVEPMFLPNHLQISITEILFHESKK